jgi:HAMP domain-containing protein
MKRGNSPASSLISGIIIVAIVALSWLIGSALSRRLRVASQVAGAIAEGRFDNAIVVETRDESGQMLASMRQMQDQLQRFNGEMQTMIRLQQGEDIGHRIPEDFPGDYGTLARGQHRGVRASGRDHGSAGNHDRIRQRRPASRHAPPARPARPPARGAGREGQPVGDQRRHRAVGRSAARGDFSARGDVAATAMPSPRWCRRSTR